MKKELILILLSTFLLSCNKSEPIDDDDKEELTYTTEVKFNQTLINPKQVYLNGVELTNYTFSSKTGDNIKLTADNDCVYSPMTGITDCPNYGVSIYLDGIEKASNECECELLELNYTVE